MYLNVFKIIFLIFLGPFIKKKRPNFVFEVFENLALVFTTICSFFRFKMRVDRWFGYTLVTYGRQVS